MPIPLSMVHQLHLQADSPAMLARFDQAAHDTLAAVAAVSVGVDQVTPTSDG